MGTDLYLTIGDKKFNMGRLHNYIGPHAFYRLTTSRDRERFQNLLEAQIEENKQKLFSLVSFTPTTFSDHELWLSTIENTILNIFTQVKILARLEILCELLVDDECKMEIG